jgi:hypothetical protein
VRGVKPRHGTMRVVLALAAAALATVTVASERGDIKDRCEKVAGKFGKDMIKACVQRDVDAWKALDKYPDDAAEIIEWCRQRRQDLGWKLVKSCSDRELAARERVAALPDPTNCAANREQQGWAAVLECIEAAAPPS